MQAISRFNVFLSQTVETVFGMTSSFAVTSLKRGANETMIKAQAISEQDTLLHEPILSTVDREVLTDV